MKRNLIFPSILMVSLVASTLQGATVYKDIAAGDVTSLTNELAQSRNGNTVVIRLAAGDYDLTGIEMNSGSHLYLDNRAIVGQGDSPWKTRLIGDGTKRIIRADNTLWYDGNMNCRVENLTVTNGWTSGDGGGISGYPNIINTVVIGNHAEGNGGGIGGYGYCRNLTILNNTAKGVGGGAFHPNYIYNSVIRGNSAQNGGGVGADTSYGSITNCVIEDNVALGYGGGVRYVRKIIKCQIAGNSAEYYGGGIYGGDMSTKTYAIMDSTICSNKSTYTNLGYGGGVYQYSMTNCFVFANYGRYGGGISKCYAYKCQFYDNYAIGAGGAVHASTCVDCELGGNIVGESLNGYNAYQSKLINCDISKTGIADCSSDSCKFHDIGRIVSIDNPYVAAVVTNVNIYIGVPICTNCLFVNNRQEWYYNSAVSKKYGQIMFQGVDGTTRSAQIVNCTIVSNTIGQMFAYCRTPASPWNVENSVFFGNVCYYGSGDLVNYDHNITNGIFFTRCAYGVSSGKFSSAGPSIWTKAGETNYKFGANGFPAKPVFMYQRKHGSEYPFSLWYTSPLCGRGKVEDWMSSAYDIRGDADGGKYLRLRDGKCDIGCYQCWEKIPGITISLK